MRRPQDKLPQRELVYVLARSIDLVMAQEVVTPGRTALREANLHVVLDENPRSAFSTHVLHNIGARRARWLLAWRDAHASQAGSASST